MIYRACGNPAKYLFAGIQNEKVKDMDHSIATKRGVSQIINNRMTNSKGINQLAKAHTIH